ncbi:hypothetical protein, partial [Pyrobaculum sp.]|uniref:hypothetical protein n=1 Tax=Pyrobaculum sp. TaxID=2004705 RepID=UPI003D0B5A55
MLAAPSEAAGPPEASRPPHITNPRNYKHSSAELAKRLRFEADGGNVAIYVDDEYIQTVELSKLARPGKRLIASIRAALKKNGAAPSDAEIVTFLRLVAKNGGRAPEPKEDVERKLHEVLDYAKALIETGRADAESPWASAIVLKRDKENVDRLEKANAVAIIPSRVSPNLAVLDVDSNEAIEIVSEYLDVNKALRVLGGPLTDAQMTPEGKWRTPSGEILESVERRLHIPVYIPEGCRDAKAPGLEVRCKEPINMFGVHPSGAMYELVDAELAALSWDAIETILTALGGENGEAPPRCQELKPLEEYDKILEAFKRIYAKAQAYGYTRHDAIYDLASLARRACIAEEYIIKIVEDVYEKAGEESQTLPQRKSHVKRAYREGAKIRSRKRILEKWRVIDAEAAEVLAKAFKAGPEEFSICIAKTEDKCLTELYGKLTDGGMEAELLKHGEDGAVSVLLYRGPALSIVEDTVTKQRYYKLGDLFVAQDVDIILEKLKQPGARGLYVDVKNIDKIKVVFDGLARREKGTFVTGLLPGERGLYLSDPYGVIAKAPSLKEAVIEFDKALRLVAEAYPPANVDAALATVGYIIALNIAPAVWAFRPHLEVPVLLIYGESRLGKSKLVEKIVEPAVFGYEGLLKLAKIWERIGDSSAAGFL